MIKIGAGLIKIGTGLIKVVAGLIKVVAGLIKIVAGLIKVGAALIKIGAALIKIGANTIRVVSVARAIPYNHKLLNQGAYYKGGKLTSCRFNDIKEGFGLLFIHSKKMSIMARVKLGISGLSIPDKIQVCAEIVSKMAGNAAFQNPDPKLTEVGDAITKLSNSYQAAINRDTLLKATMYLDEKGLDDIMWQLAAYVQTASKGDEAVILSSGMKVIQKAGAEKPVTTPMNLRCLPTDKTGVAPLTWDRVEHARMYYLQISQHPEDEASWKDFARSTRVSFTATGLEKGQEYWFRVSAGGTMGDSAWSDPAKRVVA